MCGTVAPAIASRNALIAAAMVGEEACRSEPTTPLVDLIRPMLLEDAYVVVVEWGYGVLFSDT